MGKLDIEEEKLYLHHVNMFISAVKSTHFNEGSCRDRLSGYSLHNAFKLIQSKWPRAILLTFFTLFLTDSDIRGPPHRLMHSHCHRRAPPSEDYPLGSPITQWLLRLLHLAGPSWAKTSALLGKKKKFGAASTVCQPVRCSVCSDRNLCVCFKQTLTSVVEHFWAWKKWVTVSRQVPT